jgi:hypothetical protein
VCMCVCVCLCVCVCVCMCVCVCVCVCGVCVACVCVCVCGVCARYVARHQIVIYLAIAALMGSLYDIVHNHFVKLTSSLTMSIMGNLKVTSPSPQPYNPHPNSL